MSGGYFCTKAETYLGPCETSVMKPIYGNRHTTQKPLLFPQKDSMAAISQGPKYSSEMVQK